MKSARCWGLLLIPALLAACGEEPTREAASGAGGHSTESHEAESVSFGAALAQIRGHHLISLELYKAGDARGAAVHAGHPIAEILDSVDGELEAPAPEVAADLSQQLAAGTQAIVDERTPAKLGSIYSEVAATTERAQRAVVGADASTSSFKGSVISALLATAGHEYEEAVGDQGVRLLVEYQDGYAFVGEARRLYDEIANEVRSAAAEEAEEIEEAFDSLREAFPSPKPPKEPVAVLEVTSAIELIGHELEETVHATPVIESDPEAIAAEIEELLDEVIKRYEDGEADTAAELSAEAYLENYEVIEAEVIELAPEVNAELEPLLGADLRKEINADAPVADIKAMVARAKKLLGRALAAIEGH